jgi:hypothetical protein
MFVVVVVVIVVVAAVAAAAAGFSCRGAVYHWRRFEYPVFLFIE